MNIVHYIEQIRPDRYTPWDSPRVEQWEVDAWEDIYELHRNNALTNAEVGYVKERLLSK